MVRKAYIFFLHETDDNTLAQGHQFMHFNVITSINPRHIMYVSHTHINAHKHGTNNLMEKMHQQHTIFITNMRESSIACKM